MSAITDLLLLVGVEVPEEHVKVWDEGTRESVVNWATNAYLNASDNDVEVPPRPATLTPYVVKAEVDKWRADRSPVEIVPLPLEVQKQIDTITQHIRTACSRFIGDPMPTVGQLKAACDRALDRMRRSDLIPLMGSRTEATLRMALEVGFGLRDPKDLIDRLEAASDEELEELVNDSGPGPANLFAMVRLKRVGEVDYVITGSRPGLLEMSVTYKQPLRWIRLDVVLSDDDAEKLAEANFEEAAEEGWRR